MVNTAMKSGYKNIGGIAMGDPISAPFDPKKHLESSSYTRAMGSEKIWLGILNLLDNYNKMKMPFLSMTEMNKNVVEVEGAGSSFEFGIPFIKGCPYIVENISGDNPKVGQGNKPFFIVLSENVFHEGDILTTDWRNGIQIRIQTQTDKGKDAEIIPYLNGYRYMVALDSYEEQDYYPQDFLEPFTPYFKAFSIEGGEFASIQSGYSGTMSGDDKTSLQLYKYNVGHSDQSIHAWVTADATYREFNLENRTHPAVAHLNGASTDVLQYWTEKDGKGKLVFWIPKFMEKMTMELAKMKENFLMWGQGQSFVSNGREKIVTGLGFYQQIKQRGNYDTFTDFRQLFNMVMNFSEKLFTIHNKVAVKDRVVRLRGGKLAIAELRKQFQAYFKTDNPFIVQADHPALVKAGMLKTDASGGIIYRPLQFNAIEFPEQGLLVLEHDETLDRIDDYLENPQMSSYLSNSSGMVFIEDITEGNFTNAFDSSMKQAGKNYGNVTMIKKKGYVDKTEFITHSDCSERLLQMLGVPGSGRNPVSWQKGLEMRMSTQGEIWVQDPSRVWLLEYDPYGEIKQNNKQHTQSF